MGSDANSQQDPIMPCMNRTSATVCWTRDRSTASSAAMTRLDSPGAPGWTRGGPDSALGGPGSTLGGPGSTLAERHDAAATITRRVAIRYVNVFTRKSIHLVSRDAALYG